MSKRINVTKPIVHDQKLLFELLKKSLKSGIFTNNGPILKTFEKKVKQKLKVKNISIIANATLGLNLAINSLEIKGEIITTPFTYIATSSAIIWSSCKPVYCDVSLKTFNIDTNKIEKLINKNTKAIMVTHVFGVPCDISKISKIAKKYKLYVIYDASHCWGIHYKNKSILEYGDISVISFNATKFFHTIEGGACVSNNSNLIKKINSMKYFGYDENKKIRNSGINAKMSEFHAAVGIANLGGTNKVKQKYMLISQKYKEYLKNNTNFFFQQNINIEENNFTYFPIVFYNKKLKTKVIKNLNKKNIYPREYFDTSLDKIYGKFNNNNSIYLSERILCLPVQYDLKYIDIKKICKIINNSF